MRGCVSRGEAARANGRGAALPDTVDRTKGTGGTASTHLAPKVEPTSHAVLSKATEGLMWESRSITPTYLVTLMCPTNVLQAATVVLYNSFSLFFITPLKSAL